MPNQLRKNKSVRWRFGRVTIAIVIGFYLFIMLFEEKLIFFPSKYPVGRWDLVSSNNISDPLSPQLSDVWFTTEDGVKLHGWHGQVSRPPHREQESETDRLSRTVILWCHGNAGNITDRYEKMVLMLQIPVNVFLFDYRGYGKSDGTTNEEGMYKDTKAAMNFLLEKQHYELDNIIIYGNSLGGAAAIELALHVSAAGLIIQSSFTSVADMAKETMPFIPSFLIRTKMNSIEKISQILCPKLFIHSPADEVVPFKLGQQLFAAASEPKQFYEVPKAGHNDAYIVDGTTYFNTFKTFILSCTNYRGD